MEAEEQTEEIKEKPKRRVRWRPSDDLNSATNSSTAARRINNLILAKAKPCRCLKRGIGSLQRDFTSLRSLHRKKLRRLLLILLRRHNWAEASGVLSVLHIGTSNELAISKTRAKFSATLEIRKRIKDSFSIVEIEKVYDLWTTKLGSMRNWPIKNRVAVRLELIILYLTSKDTPSANIVSESLRQKEACYFDGDPVSNLVVGLTAYEKWYSTLEENMRLDKQSGFGSNMQSDVFEDNMYMSVVDSRGCDAAEGRETNPLMQCDSKTSVRNDKDNMDDGVNQHGEVPMNDSMHSAESESQNISDRNAPPSLSCFYTNGLPPWLLPMQLPQLNTLKELKDKHDELLRNKDYNSAVQLLSQALNSMQPALEAFHPLIQLLLLGDKVKEALDVVEKFSSDSSTVLHLRLKARLLEHFDSNNYAKLATCFEDILKKDPTSTHSLGRLITLHRRGDYSTERLVEMIALNLDAIYANYNTWREFASCLFKLSQIDADTESVCFNGGDDELKQKSSVYVSCVPEIFTTLESEKSWRFRCRWWLTRHFSPSILVSDIASGDVELLTYKAATACHLYGPEFKYVVKVSDFLKEENNRDRLSELKMHVGNSIGFYLNLDRKKSYAKLLQ